MKNKIRFVLVFSFFFVVSSFSNINEDNNHLFAIADKISISALSDTSRPSLYKEIKKLTKQNNLDSLGRLYLFLGRSYYYENKLDSALYYLQKSRTLLTETKQIEKEKDIYLYTGDVYYMRRNYRESINWYLKALVLSDQNLISEKLGDLYSNLGTAYWGVAGSDSSLLYHKKALTVREKIPGGYKALGKTYNNLGVVYWQLSMYDLALENYLQSLKAREKAGDTSAIAVSLNNIGLTYQELKQGRQAIGYHRRALNIANQYKDIKFSLGYTLNSLAKAYRSLTMYDSALYYFDQSIKAYEQNKVESGRAFNYIDIASVYKEKKDYKKSVEYLKGALDYYTGVDNPRRISDTKLLIGENYLLMGDYYQARKFLTESLDVALQIKQKNILRDLYKNLAKTEEKIGNYYQAYEYLGKYSALQDSVISQRFQRIAAEQQARYKTELQTAQLEKKEAQLERQKILIILGIVFISSLIGVIIFIYRSALMKNKINKELEIKSGQLEELNLELNNLNETLKENVATKDKFFSIIAHDLRSPFQGFIGLTELLTEENHSFTESEIKKYIAEINVKAQNLYRLLKNLLEWAGMQRGLTVFNPSKRNIVTLVNQTIDDLRHSAENKEIIINYIGPEEIIILIDEQMMRSVLRNLITNAIKFTNRNGSIIVEAQNTDNQLKISVKDTGIGMSPQIVSKLFQLDQKVREVGTEGEESTGLGLILCKEFVEKHNGKIWVESTENKGSRFFFTIPS